MLKLNTIIILLAVAFLRSVNAGELPVIEVESVVSPLRSSRMWQNCVVRNAAGQPVFIAHFMNYKGTTSFKKTRGELPDGKGYFIGFEDVEKRPDAEWLIANLATGKCKIIKLPGFHSVRYCVAGNGRVFFSVDYAHIYYYDPKEETIKNLGQVMPWKPFENDRTFYQLKVGPDGMVYGTTQAYNTKTSLIRLNPETLEYKIYHDIGTGKRKQTLTYGYYLEVVPPWAYVAVGQEEWELFAVNIETGEKRLLAERSGLGARCVVSAGKLAPIAELIGQNGQEKVGRELKKITQGKDSPGKMFFWCADGYLYPRDGNAGSKLPFEKSQDRVFEKVKLMEPIEQAGKSLPKLKPGSLTIDSDGRCRIEFIGPDGDAGAIYATFQLDHTEATPIESLIILPDKSLFGNVAQYQGFFRCYPQSAKTEVFRGHGPSRVKSVVIGGKVYFCGYPNMNLWEYDPDKPWTSDYAKKAVGKRSGNPCLLAYLGQGVSGAHYCNFIRDGGNGRIYLAGKRERWSTGTGLAYYDLKKGTSFGLRNKLKTYHPQGLAVFPEARKVVFSGTLIGKQATAPAQLIVCDENLNELKRLTVQPELTSTGSIIYVPGTENVLGITDKAGKKLLYLINTDTGKLMMHKDVDAQSISPVFIQPSDQSLWVIIDRKLNKLNPDDLQLTPIVGLSKTISYPCWCGDTLYGACKGSLVKAKVKTRLQKR